MRARFAAEDSRSVRETLAVLVAPDDFVGAEAMGGGGAGGGGEVAPRLL